jgi:hypothetical protein
MERLYTGFDIITNRVDTSSQKLITYLRFFVVA